MRGTTSTTYSLFLSNANNALSIIVDGESNERAAMIQSGHASNSFAQYLGMLALNPLGGNVGIGTISPSYKLDVAGDVRLHTNLRILRASTTPNEYLNITMGDSVAYYDGYDSADGFVNHVFRSNGRTLMYIYGTSSPTYRIDIYGNARVQGNFVATGAITAGSASDARLKTNIQSLSAESAKRIVMALNPVTFTWNEKAGELYNQYKGDDLGMIAQEVEPYLPSAVGTIFENYKRLDYTKVISPLVKVAQDHESRIRQLEKENRELRKQLNMN